MTQPTGPDEQLHPREEPARVGHGPPETLTNSVTDPGAAYGEALIERLSGDLTRCYGRGFSR
jgi:hypothetical protein